MSANYSQYQKDSSMYRNAAGSQPTSWDEWFDKIVGTGQQIFGSAQNIKDTITGDQTIDQGSLGGGYGQYTATSGVTDPNEGKSTSPLIWGLVILGVVGAAFFTVSAFTKNKGTVKQ